MMDKFSDRMDMDIKVSLYEYGLIRNPETNKVIWCLNYGVEHSKDRPPKIRTSYISLEEVKEYLENDASEGFYNYMESTKEKELERITNNWITDIIFSANQYDGAFLEFFHHEVGIWE